MYPHLETMAMDTCFVAAAWNKTKLLIHTALMLVVS